MSKADHHAPPTHSASTEVGGATTDTRGVAHPRKPFALRLKDATLRFGMVWFLILLILWAQVTYPGFLAWGNLQNLLSQNAQLGIIAVGMTYVMIARGLDLSVGATYAGCAVVYAQLALTLPIPLAFVLTLLVGAAAGAVNGAIITLLKVNPFVATLGTGSVFGGAAFLFSNSSPVLNNQPGFDWLGLGIVAAVPVSVWLMIVVFVIAGFILARTPYGRSIYAIGGNPEAARLAGLRVEALSASTYMLVGLCAAIGGCIIASRLSVGQADVGSTIVLDVIAVVVIGGTSLFGGEGAMWRTAIGLLIIAIIRNVSQSSGFDVNVESVITGAIVVGAVALDAYARRRRA